MSNGEMNRLLKTLHEMEQCEANPKAMQSMLQMGFEFFGTHAFLAYAALVAEMEFIKTIMNS